MSRLAVLLLGIAAAANTWAAPGGLRQPASIGARLAAGKLSLTLPERALGRDILWVTTLASPPFGLAFAGETVGSSMVRFVRRGDEIVLIQPDLGISTSREEMAEAVRLNTQPVILHKFAIQAAVPEGLQIDASAIFLGSEPDPGVGGLLRAGALDVERSYIERCETGAEGLEVSVTQTFAKPEPKAAAGKSDSEPPRRMDLRSRTARVHHSLILLPEKPMTARLVDPRIGFFSVDAPAYDGEGYAQKSVSYVKKWRLEKKNPGAAVSEPVKQIVFYIAPEVPRRWRKSIRLGIEDWLPVLEKAGFRNALRVVELEAGDLNGWLDPDNRNLSFVRWAAFPDIGAMGTTTNDPRTGETLSARIYLWNEILHRLELDYFVLASAQDPRARKLPLPEDLLGDLIRGAVQHEVGHTFGMRHNFKASTDFSIEELRDRDFTAKNGITTSVMNYARYNYIAQPGDGARLTHLLGPYDELAIEWAYTPDPANMEKLLSRQKGNPRLQWGEYVDGDSSVRGFLLGNDAVQGARLGFQNMRTVMSYVVPATLTPGRDHSLLKEVYGHMHKERKVLLGHVASLIGAAVRDRSSLGEAQPVYRPVEPARQREALRYLLQEAFVCPAWLYDRNVLDLLEDENVLARWEDEQKALFADLLSAERLNRMAAQEATDRSSAYPLAEFLRELNAAFAGDDTEADPFRLVTRRIYVQSLQALSKQDSKAGISVKAQVERALATGRSGSGDSRSGPSK